MEQTDWTERQLQQLEMAFQIIFSKFFELKIAQKLEKGIEVTNEKLYEQFDIDIEKMLYLEASDLFKYLQSKNLNIKQIAQITDYLADIVVQKCCVEKTLPKKAMLEIAKLYEIIANNTQTFSLESLYKQERLYNKSKDI